MLELLTYFTLFNVSQVAAELLSLKVLTFECTYFTLFNVSQGAAELLSVKVLTFECFTINPYTTKM